MTHTIVISDLHGMSHLLYAALDKIKASGLDISKIVFTGDYVDRGPDSAGVVARVRELVEAGEAIALKGNHEDMMVQAFNEFGDYDPSASPWWLPNGGSETIDSFHTMYFREGSWVEMGWAANWMRKLPLYYQDEHRIYVHGFADPNQPDPDKFTPDITMWERYDKTEDFGWYGKHVVHGHTPRKAPELLKNRTNLDTGAVFGRPLSVGVFDDSIPGGPVEVWEIT